MCLKKYEFKQRRVKNMSGEIEKGQDEGKLAMAYKVVLTSFFIN